ncbi:MAG: hypothetical protein JO103_09055 [Candidatus Eremiobacteraeota bacterium]|nr:hypothetical protein [Candidatus Eremiobacteraeota bacterium]MBV9407862.1 hypothetical protein [Candidatus Eremiobacteraeota bacterium]
MLTEARFDDLDLREEPSRGDTDANPVHLTTTHPAGTVVCTTTQLCTHGCCTTPG